MKIKIDLNQLKVKSKDLLDSSSEVAKKVGEKTVEIAGKAKETIGEGIDEFRLNMMNPVFDDYLDSDEYQTPQLVRVVLDNKRREDELCQGSIGYIEKKEGMQVLNIYQDCLEKFGFDFYPTLVNDQLYYYEPNRSNSFVRLTEFFSEMQKSKFAELEQIAYKLGAKHYVISVSEEAYKMTSNKTKGNFASKTSGNKLDVEASDKEESDVKVTIGVDKRFKESKKPERPELVWFKNDQQLLSLIEMRCSEETQQCLESNKLVFDCKSTSVISMDVGVKLDAMIKSYGFKTNFSVKSAVEEEYRKKLVFNIEF